ncbi:AAA family ATPase [Portibacter lacus]|uniref:Magnesium chelatase n=1 Tax=Portibacter lacus TaxID=1099794 RepID=A0AA37WE11_9BACT|nr:MoxR family ATPase [Portibacter lacus]GLR16632.1 magnesium chelatase [Portibacter lacus]
MSDNYQSRIDLTEVKSSFDAIKMEIEKVIIGQKDMVDLLLVSILANGHVLIEGNPGLAKTLTAKLLSKVITTDFSRIQFTPDLMPSDILGTSVFNFQTSEFEFKKGPIFSNIILIDEINRAPAKTQSALFEVMEEKQVTIDGSRYKMTEPFMIVATQNPIDMEGTYRLPEAQMDRFIFKITIEYPTLEEEILIINKHHDNQQLLALDNVVSIVKGTKIIEHRALLDKVVVDEKIIKFIAQIVQATRSSPNIYVGASPRASLALLNAGKAHAILNGRDFVTPEDILRISPYVLNHRITLTPEKEMEGTTSNKVIEQLIKGIEIPR